MNRHIEGRRNLVRDSSGAIQNIDKAGLAAAKAKKAKAEQIDERLDRLEEKVDQIMAILAKRME